MSQRSARALTVWTRCRELQDPRHCGLGRDGLPGLETRAWGQQAETLLCGVSKRQYCSVATHAEAKLREALHRCGELAASHLDEDPKPDRLRTAVCCQLLRDLSQHAGPFAAVLKTICDELVRVPCLPSKPCSSTTPCARVQRLLC